MLMRALVLLVLASTMWLGGPAAMPATAEAQDAVMSTAELMRATALDEVFTQFGAAIESSPGEQGVAFDAPLMAVWVEAAREVFDARAMHGALARALEGRLGDDEHAVLARFFRSDFGRRITELERGVQALPPPGQLAARAEGQALVEGMPADSRRARQFDEMLGLVNADIAAAIVGQSVRGMLIGLAVARRRGDIEVPWAEIELHLAQIMPDLEADVAATQRAITAYAYRGLGEAELDRYLEFLRTDAARKFYALATYSIGSIITASMTRFGQALAAKLSRVGV